MGAMETSSIRAIAKELPEDERRPATSCFHADSHIASVRPAVHLRVGSGQWTMIQHNTMPLPEKLDEHGYHGGCMLGRMLGEGDRTKYNTYFRQVGRTCTDILGPPQCTDILGPPQFDTPPATFINVNGSVHLINNNKMNNTILVAGTTTASACAIIHQATLHVAPNMTMTSSPPTLAGQCRRMSRKCLRDM